MQPSSRGLSLLVMSMSTHVYFFKHSDMFMPIDWNTLALVQSYDSHHEPAGVGTNHETLA